MFLPPTPPPQWPACHRSARPSCGCFPTCKPTSPPSGSPSGCSSPAGRSRPRSNRSTASWASPRATTRCKRQRRSACTAPSRRHRPGHASRPPLTYIGAMPQSPSAPHDRRRWNLPPAPDATGAPGGEERSMGQTLRFQEILRRLAIIDEGFAEDQAGLGLGVAASRLLDPKTAALVRVGALVAIGSPGVCLEWGTTRALAAGASEDEVADVLLAIAPVAGLGRVTGAVPGVAAALGYDVEAALMDPDDH